MLSRCRLSLLVGGFALGLLLFGGVLSLAPSTRTDHVATVPASYGDWSVRDDLGVPKSTARPRMRCKAALVVDNAAGEIVYARNRSLKKTVGKDRDESRKLLVRSLYDPDTLLAFQATDDENPWAEILVTTGLRNSYATGREVMDAAEILRRTLYDLWVDFGEIKIRAYLGDE